jgi:hypothetical protein
MTTTPDPGDAWRYCDPIKLADPAVTHALVQAALQVFLSVRYARTRVNPDEVGTHIDWKRIERELQAALRLAGHPAGDEFAQRLDAPLPTPEEMLNNPDWPGSRHHY